MDTEARSKPKRRTAPVYVSKEWDDFLRRLSAQHFLNTGEQVDPRQLVEQALAKAYGAPKAVSAGKRVAKGG
jgi:hypothetical protein